MNDQRIVVVIEDDMDIRNLVQGILEQAGFEVHTAGWGRAGVDLVLTKRPGVVTLDLGLPDIDGFEVARLIRRFSDTYILMLTARGNEPDTVEGFISGADDYLTKPFRPRELRARIDGMLRRPRRRSDVLPASPPTSGADAPVTTFPSPVECVTMSGEDRFEHKGLKLDNSTRCAFVGDRPLKLTRTEFDLLRVLLESGNRVRTKSELARRLRLETYDTGSYIGDGAERIVEVHMANLRRKLGDDSRSPRWLKTVRGVGYTLTELD